MVCNLLRKLGLGFVGMAFLWGCAAQEWRVRDAAGQSQTVQDIRFEPGERLEFRVGSSRKWLEANQIRWMEVDPSVMQTESGRIYYGARLLLQDGSRYPDSASVDTVHGVLMPVDGMLVGSAQVGRVEFPLAQLRELGTSEHYAPPKKE